MRTQIPVKDLGAPYPLLPVDVLAAADLKQQREDNLLTTLALLSLNKDMTKPETWVDLAEHAEKTCPELAEELLNKAAELEAKV